MTPLTPATTTDATAQGQPAARPLRPAGLVLLLPILGLVGWVAVALIAKGLLDADSRNVGFDLSLVLGAGRAIAEGRSPYSPEMLAGGAPDATNLFFSYPPPIGQAAVLFGGIPLLAAVALLGLVATAGAALVGERLRSALSPATPRWLAGLAVVTVLPWCLPFATALLFGNLDVLFPLLYGIGILGAVAPAHAVRVRIGAGVAVALAAVTKLYPGVLGLWFLIRGLRERRRTGHAPSWQIVAAAIATGVVILVVSLALGGSTLWSDYGTVVRSASSSAVIDPRNAGPAAQVALLLHLDESTARLLHLPVALAAVVVTIWAAWTRDDPLEGIAWAAVASMVLLPLTWYHYPAALVPLVVAATLRRPQILPLTIGVLVVIDLAIAWLPLVWVAVALTLLAVRLSATGTSGRPVTAPGAA